MHTLWIRIVLSCSGIALVVIAALGTVDRAGFHYSEQSFKRALVTFAVARGLNGVISVAQGTEVAIEPAGIGVNFAPGQILDPLNDLVEWFSWVMLAAATSLGIQQLLLSLFSAAGFTWLLGAVVAGWLLTLWLPSLAAMPRLRLWSLRLVLLLTVLRFAVPVVALGSEALYHGFLQERYETSRQNIEQVTDKIGRINRSAEESIREPRDESLVGNARRLYQSAVAALDVRGYIEKYEQAATDVSEQVINMIVLFLAQTVLLPLLFLWLLLQLARRIVRLD